MQLPEWWGTGNPYKIMDCIEGMDSIPDDSVDCFILDPPYSTGARDGTRSARGKLIRADDRGWFLFDNMTTRGFTFFLRAVCLMILRKAKVGAFVHIFCDWRQCPNVMDIVESAGLLLQNIIVWDKISFGMGVNYRNQHEFIVVASKGEPRQTKHDCANVIAVGRRKNPEHPTEKPEKLIEKLILTTTERGEIVVDPFLGSGATLEACRKTGRLGLGFEISPDFEGIIRRRCEVSTPDLKDFESEEQTS